MTGILKVDQLKDNAGTDIFDASGTNITIGRSTGVVKIAKIPHLKVGLASNTTVNSGDRVLFGSFNTSHVFMPEDNMSAFDVASNSYIIPTGCSGLWHISCSIYGVTSNPNQIAVWYNGNRQDAIGSSGGTSSMVQGSMIKRLAAGDDIEMHVYCAGSTVTPTQNQYHSWWEMTFIG